MSADKDFRLRAGAKICGVAAVATLAFIALCPADWVPRTNLGFELDHFLAFFVVTLMVWAPAIAGWRSARDRRGAA